MKKTLFILLMLSFVITTSCKKDKKETEVITEETVNESQNTTPTANKVNPNKSKGEIKKIKVALESKSGSTVTGNAVFTEENGVVSMVILLEGLTEGTHAIHLHEKADCSAADGTSSGGHWNPTAQPHGQWGSAEGYHKGDIGNIVANANGRATKSFSTDQWCIGCGDAELDIVGKAIIVHESTDDFKTQPTGNAGGRVSCGGIIQ